MKRTDVREMIMQEMKKLGKSRSIESIPVTELCARCEISRQTFYSYFHDKYDLISQIYGRTITDVIKETTDSVPWETVIGRMLVKVREDSQFYINAVRYTGQNSLSEMMLHHIYTGYIKELSRRKGADLEEELLFEARYNAHGGTGCMLDWIHGEMQEDPYEIAAKIIACMPKRMKSYFERNPEGLKV